MDAEVAVVGLGSMGSMAAWRLAAAGADVLGFDRFGIADGRTAAAGESRALVRALAPDGPPVSLVDRAIELWRQLEDESGQSLYVRSGTLALGNRSSARMRALAELAGSGFEVLDHAETRRRYPAHLMAPDDIAVFEREGGVVKSEPAVVAAAQLATEHGARLVTGHPVERIESGPGGVSVEAGGRTYRVRRAVVTPGPWASEVLPELAHDVVALRCAIAWWTAADATLFTPERFPSFIRGDEGTGDYFGLPALDGTSVKFAKLDTYGAVTPADPLDQHLEDSIVEAHRARLRATLTGLHDRPRRILVAMDGFTPDGAPVIGPLPGKENVIVATGFSGTGFRLAPVIGELLAGIVTSGTVPEGLAGLSPQRFTRREHHDRAGAPEPGSVESP